jgi:hypothetical protein
MNKSAKKGLRVESLEIRAMMAGDVKVTVSDGVLNIIGDYKANGVEVTQLDNGNYQVSGITWGGSATKINGGTSPKEFAAHYVRDDIRADLGAGDDALRIYDLYAPDDIEVKVGDGKDIVNIVDVYVKDDVLVDSGKGDDTVTVSDSTIKEILSIKTAAGNDKINVEYTDIYKLLAIHAGDGNDKITTNYVSAAYGLIFEGLGSDYVTKKKTNFTIVPGSNYIPKVAQTDAAFDALVNAYGNIL